MLFRSTGEVLKAIADSPEDVQPVFDVIVQSCRRLFAGKTVSLVMPRDDMIEAVAYASDTPDQEENMLKPWPLDRESASGTCILESRLIAIADVAEGVKQFPRMSQLAMELA